MAVLFVADVHLDAGPAGRERMADFVAFLRRIDSSSVNRLVLLGDLFDFWFEYHHVIFSGYFEVLRAFAELRDQGMAFDLLCGNHDFWAGRFLENELGFKIHRGAAKVELGGLNVLMMHGDGLNPRDWGYRAYKRIARARWAIALFRLLHPDRAMALARGVSRSSRRLTLPADESASGETLALRAFAKDALAKGDADVVILGHAHYPLREEHPTPKGTGLYINAGDWLSHHSYVLWDGEDFHLHVADEHSGA
ncbi:MAG TPA: UDP-2,3-diacylglucosamine diphosphatase [Candidatus Hydrogenedentes bacterium]|nr:UDP-2,3-diacylglucosamine diphosphatase [Candidatus Hydrogenedentota bacterium]